MNLKTVSTILAITSIVMLGLNIYIQADLMMSASGEFEFSLWHAEGLGVILFYSFSAYFFWNFRERIK